jgi:hypothetical protein
VREYVVHVVKIKFFVEIAAGLDDAFPTLTPKSSNPLMNPR